MLLALKDTILPDLPAFLMVYPSDFAVAMTPESLRIIQHLPWNTMLSLTFTWATKNFANLSQLLNWSHLKPGGFCLSMRNSRCLWTFWLRLSVESCVSTKLLLIIPLKLMSWNRWHSSCWTAPSDTEEAAREKLLGFATQRELFLVG